jgi:hypothetical protein
MADQPDIAKIKRNIEKMIGLNAPESDIDAYIASEGVTVDQLKSPMQPKPLSTMQPRSTGDEIGRQLGLTGRYIAEGGMAFPNMIGDAANTAINMGIRGVNAGIDQFRDNPQEPVIPYLMKPSEATKGVLNAVGAPKPETMLERIVAEPSKFLASIPGFAGPVMAGGERAAQYLAPVLRDFGNQAAGAVTGGTAYGIAKEVAPDSPLIQMGAALGGGILGGGGYQMMANRGAPPTVPSTGDLRNMAQAAYSQADDAGAIIRPEAMQRLAASVTDDLAEFGYHPQLQPRIATVLTELQRVGQENITTKGIQTLRRIAGNAAMSTDPSERALGARIIGQIDDLLANITPDDVVQGNADEAAQGLREGARLWSQFRKSEMVDEAVEKGVRRAASTGSGGNEENAIRQNIRSILDSASKRRGFNAEEIAAMERVVRGGPIQNMFRLVGKLSPSGNGLMAALGLGAVASGGPLGIAPVAGLVAKPIAEQLGRRSINALSDTIRRGGILTQGLPEVTVPGGLLGSVPMLYGGPR